jgi:1,4-dihydroxy-2-naphthoate octaprenyltransferase
MLAYATPPLRLAYSGYGELIQAIGVANLFPALGYLLQVGDLHNLLALMTFPLTFLVLASLLARSLQRYMEDLRRERQTMLVRVGWERGMTLHNALIAMAYLALVIAVFAGLPRNLALPAFLSLPVAVYQIWQMNNIAQGVKPRWRLLAWTALASAGLAAYFMAFALWTG